MVIYHLSPTALAYSQQRTVCPPLQTSAVDIRILSSEDDPEAISKGKACEDEKRCDALSEDSCRSEADAFDYDAYEIRGGYKQRTFEQAILCEAVI